jgi:hypothetical protein
VPIVVRPSVLDRADVRRRCNLNRPRSYASFAIHIVALLPASAAALAARVLPRGPRAQETVWGRARRNERWGDHDPEWTAGDDAEGTTRAGQLHFTFQSAVRLSLPGSALGPEFGYVRAKNAIHGITKTRYSDCKIFDEAIQAQIHMAR